MARPKKADANKLPAPVAPAPPAMIPMPNMQQQQQHHLQQQMQPLHQMQHQQHQMHHQQPQHLAPQAIAQQPMQQQMGAGIGAGMPVQQRTIGVEEFVRVRDSVAQRFNTITALMKNFADDFVRQTNLLIGEPAPFDNGPGPSMQALVASLNGIGGELGDLLPVHEEKKERKKRTHDQNAPKRPLTPYFLYMQTARPIIANDLGTEAPKGAVQEEGQRRWASMTPNEKTAWNNAYQFNLRLYNARVHSYKAGNPDAKAMSDPDALSYADANGIPQAELANEEAIAPNDHDAIAEQLQMAVPMEDVKTPKPKATRKRKSTAADVEEGETSGAKVSTPASPDKKRKRASKAADITEEPKKSARKKKTT
ncbi:Uu.00g034020.m01.CDS01 [Anthostomella pinea]|uniref:Uu.00g034020.m01.CDS01 n=1 Tax=Anthostomella pinea TaxID=933095 RepID=A0AAI8YAX4_9PEZI|nr:Uu.00g034020.m01.CDS01 [Anthostomella pinea]